MTKSRANDAAPPRPARPAHHAPGGGFRNPWPGSERAGALALARWLIVERAAARLGGRDGARDGARNAAAPAVPRATPAFDAPRAAADAITATWVGHSTFLLQVGGWNVLTDPVWGARASPLAWAGPRRLTAPGVALDALPPVDLVLLSHDHYDHLDDPTVRAIATRWPGARWMAPLGVAARLRARGARDVVELDWWARADAGPLEVACVPAQHFSGRGLADRDRTLWCGWVLRPRAAATDAGTPDGAPARAVLFAGDTALHPEFAAIARRFAPIALALLPVGAYAPRWFMRPVHCDPDDAVAAYAALAEGARDAGGAAARGAAPVMGGMHWGTFRLTDEPLDEPPRRTRDAWARAGRDAALLWLPALGETRRV